MIFFNNDLELIIELLIDILKLLFGFIIVMIRRGSCLYKVKNIFIFFFLLIIGYFLNFNINLEFG